MPIPVLDQEHSLLLMPSLWIDNNTINDPFKATAMEICLPSDQIVNMDLQEAVPYQKVMDFISKIGQVVLKARVEGSRDLQSTIASSLQLQEDQHRRDAKLASVGRLPHMAHSAAASVRPFNNHPIPAIDIPALLERTEFWKSGMPLNIDIYLERSRLLLERWVISFESSHSPTHTHHNHRHHSYSHRQQSEVSHKEDHTDLILLVQSLYSYIRLMPLHTALCDGTILKKTDLRFCATTADGYPLSPVSDDEDCSDTSPFGSPDRNTRRGDYFSRPDDSTQDDETSPPLSPNTNLPSIAFDLSAKLKVYKFRSAASGTEGKLHLSVVYDSGIAGLLPVHNVATRKSISPIKSPVKHKTSSGDLTEGLPGQASYSPSHGKPPRAATAPPESRRRSKASLGSPFPSPTIQKRVVSLAHYKVGGGNPANAPLGLGLVDLASSTGSSLFASMGSEDPPVLELDNSGEPQSPVPQESRSRPEASPFAEALRFSMEPTSKDFHNGGTSLMPIGNSALSEDRKQKIRKPDLRVDIPSSSRRDGSGHSPEKTSKRRLSATTTMLRSINVPLSIAARPPHPQYHRSTSLGSFATATGLHSTSTPSDAFGPLVGSYEESMLSGRMSTLPSKPIQFLAEIGVIGFGKGATRGLRCPPHMCVEFDAYFYEMGEDEVLTPYVGFIEVGAAKKKQQKEQYLKLKEKAKVDSHVHPNGSHDEDLFGAHADHEETGHDDEDKAKRSGGSSSHRAEGYRIPPKGQLQILIKNPARTAIKLFLIPYDFRDMPNDSKTFLRQKSYAVGSSTSGPPSLSPSTSARSHRPHAPSMSRSATTGHSSNSSHSTPSAATASSHPHLRYAIHVPIFRTEKGRIYVGPSVRVVFSHRALDGDEKVLVVNEGLGSGDSRYARKSLSDLNLVSMPAQDARSTESLIKSAPMHSAPPTVASLSLDRTTSPQTPNQPLPFVIVTKPPSSADGEHAHHSINPDNVHTMDTPDDTSKVWDCGFR